MGSGAHRILTTDVGIEPDPHPSRAALRIVHNEQVPTMPEPLAFPLQLPADVDDAQELDGIIAEFGRWSQNVVRYLVKLRERR